MVNIGTLRANSQELKDLQAALDNQYCDGDHEKVCCSVDKGDLLKIIAGTQVEQNYARANYPWMARLGS